MPRIAFFTRGENNTSNQEPCIMFLHMWAVYRRLSFMPNWWGFNFHAVRKITQIRSTDCFQSWICRVCNFGRGICWKHGEQKHHRKTELSGMCKLFEEFSRMEKNGERSKQYCPCRIEQVPCRVYLLCSCIQMYVNVYVIGHSPLGLFRTNVNK